MSLVQLMLSEKILKVQVHDIFDRYSLPFRLGVHPSYIVHFADRTSALHYGLSALHYGLVWGQSDPK